MRVRVRRSCTVGAGSVLVAWCANDICLVLVAILSFLPSEPAPLAIAKYAVAAVLAGSTVMLFGLGILISAIQEE